MSNCFRYELLTIAGLALMALVASGQDRPYAQASRSVVNFSRKHQLTVDLTRVALFEHSRVHFGSGGELAGVEALDARGQVRWHATYDRWRDVPGGRYPYSMVFHFPMRQLVAELELDSVELNPTLDPALFSLPPEGSE